jgi:hypothetical protein
MLLLRRRLLPLRQRPLVRWAKRQYLANRQLPVKLRLLVSYPLPEKRWRRAMHPRQRLFHMEKRLRQVTHLARPQWWLMYCSRSLYSFRLLRRLLWWRLTRPRLLPPTD